MSVWREDVQAALAFAASGGVTLWGLVVLGVVMWAVILFRAMTPPHPKGDAPHPDASAAMLRALIVAAPLLGLLGTVVGMVETFDAFATLPRSMRGEGIAKGISHALVTTQVGLVHAIPGVLASRLLDARRPRAGAEMNAEMGADTGPDEGGRA